MIYFKAFCSECKEYVTHYQDGFGLPSCIRKHSFKQEDIAWEVKLEGFRAWLDVTVTTNGKLDLAKLNEISAVVSNKLKFESELMEAEQRKVS